MNANKRPLPVTIVACVYIAVGSIGFVFHLREILMRHTLHYDDVFIELTEALALLSGAFLVRGRNWARWLALAWIAFHVVFSAFNSLREFVIHALICAVIAWALFRPDSSRYFAGRQTLTP